MTQISKNFTLEELTRSDTATRLGIDEQFAPSQEIIANLTALCENVLEPLLEKLGKAIHITSGYRCERVNKAIGGAKTSQHVQGEAADFHVDGMSVNELYQFVKETDIKYSQLINEFSPTGWVHCSYDRSIRHENLIAIKVNGKTVYTKDVAL